MHLLYRQSALCVKRHWEGNKKGSLKFDAATMVEYS
jgi:hypothetical protein